MILQGDPSSGPLVDLLPDDSTAEDSERLLVTPDQPLHQVNSPGFKQLIQK